MKKLVVVPVRNFLISFIIAFSWKKFYGIMATDKTFNSKIFLYFFGWLIKSKRENYNDKEIDNVLICDNWSIHKTFKIANFFTLNLIPILTIPPYSPQLNVAEIMINRIKVSIHKQRIQWK